MAVYRLVRFTIDPADTEKMLATRVALVAATRDAFPGLTEARLAKVDEETWIDMWRWDSLARAQAAIEGAPASLRPGWRSRSSRMSPPISLRLSTRDSPAAPGRGRQ